MTERTIETENGYTAIDNISPNLLIACLNPYDEKLQATARENGSNLFIQADQNDTDASQYNLVIQVGNEFHNPDEASPLGQLNRLFNPEDEQFLRNPKERDKLAQLLQAEEIEFGDESDIEAIALLMRYYGNLQLDPLIGLYKAYKVTKERKVYDHEITEEQFNLAKRLMLDGIRRTSPQKTEVSNSIIYNKKNFPTQFPLTLEILQLERDSQYYYEIKNQETGGTFAQIGENFLPKAVLYYVTHMQKLQPSMKNTTRD